MRIVRVFIQNYRCIKEAEIYPLKSNVILGPNNIGKTTFLEALNLVLNPEIPYRGKVIDENDFYQRDYYPDNLIAQEEVPPEVDQNYEVTIGDDNVQAESDIPEIYIELVLTDLIQEDEDKFRDNLVPWEKDECRVIENTDEGIDPFENAYTAIRVFFKGWYNIEEDDFDFVTKLLPSADLDHEECPAFTREQKRHIGFLIYRDFRALTRPITLETGQLFNRLLQSFNVSPHHLEGVLTSVKDSLDPVNEDEEFSNILEEYQKEIERYLSLSEIRGSKLIFDLTDRTRNQIKASSQLHMDNDILLPLQKSGAGTRSLAILSMLMLIMRKRGRGILALEEPETFLFPHAQRRVIDEALDLSSQVFVTTHSPFVLERMPIEGAGRIIRQDSGEMYWNPLPTENIKKVNIYSKRLRQSHCEALMGTGVVIVEGDSDRWWLNGVSRIMNGEEYCGNLMEAFELLGIAVTSAETDGYIIKLGEFFFEAGLKVIGLFDCPNDPEAFSRSVVDCTFPCICLCQKGLEEILSEQLPLDILQDLLIYAPHCKTAPSPEEAVKDMNENEIRSKAQALLIKNKGSAYMHEWLLSSLTYDTVPNTLKDIISDVVGFIRNEKELNTCSLLN